jgi:oxalate decarboxylase
MKPQKSTKGGEVRIVDSTNFPAAANIAMAHVTLKPGALRELHWHPNADEWQYYIQGSGRMTVFFNRATARTIDFHPGDVGYIPQTLGHYIENTGDTSRIPATAISCFWKCSRRLVTRTSRSTTG